MKMATNARQCHSSVFFISCLQIASLIRALSIEDAPPAIFPTEQQLATIMAGPTVSPTEALWSSQPTPTGLPTELPTNFPTRLPSGMPTGLPTSTPTESPTTVPTVLPTPVGVLGKDWWYFLSAECFIWGLQESDSSDTVNTAVSYVFEFILTENLDGEEKAGFNHVETGTTSSASASIPIEELYHFDDDHFNDPLIVSVLGWSDNVRAIREMEASLKQAQGEPLWIVEPLREQGLHDINHARVYKMKVTTTAVAPPGNQELSPVRITWIIFGTVFTFALGVAVVGCLIRHFRRHPISYTFFKERLDNGVENLMRLVPDDFRAMSHRQQGFTLASKEEEFPSLDVESDAEVDIEMRVYEQNTVGRSLRVNEYSSRDQKVVAKETEPPRSQPLSPSRCSPSTPEASPVKKEMSSTADDVHQQEISVRSSQFSESSSCDQQI